MITFKKFLEGQELDPSNKETTQKERILFRKLLFALTPILGEFRAVKDDQDDGDHSYFVMREVTGEDDTDTGKYFAEIYIEMRQYYPDDPPARVIGVYAFSPFATDVERLKKAFEEVINLLPYADVEYDLEGPPLRNPDNPNNVDVFFRIDQHL